MNSFKISTKPASFYNQCVKALFVGVIHFPSKWDISRIDILRLLSYCKGVEYIFWDWDRDSSLGVDTHLAAMITDMRPKKFAGRLVDILGTLPPNFSLRFFEDITHFGSTGHEWLGWSGFPQLTCLSRIFLVWDGRLHWVGDKAIPGALKDILSCQSLQVCMILITNFNARTPPSVDAIEEALDDDRLVFIFQCDPSAFGLDYWTSYMDEKSSLWAAAESAVLMQRQHRRRGLRIRAYGDTPVLPLSFPASSSA
jgi:hypothetical protein